MVQLSFGAEPSIVIKFAHQTNPNDPGAKGIDYFAKQLAERTKGRVKVDVYPAAMLYKDTEIIPAVRDGAIPMGSCSTNLLESYIPMAEIFSLPFLCSTQESVKKIKHEKPGELLIEKMERIGLKHIWWNNNAFIHCVYRQKIGEKAGGS